MKQLGLYLKHTECLKNQHFNWGDLNSNMQRYTYDILSQSIYLLYLLIPNRWNNGPAAERQQKPDKPPITCTRWWPRTASALSHLHSSHNPARMTLLSTAASFLLHRWFCFIWLFNKHAQDKVWNTSGSTAKHFIFVCFERFIRNNQVNVWINSTLFYLYSSES